MKLFVLNTANNDIEIQTDEILLVKEFAELWNVNRNKCKKDPTGVKRLRAKREFAYMWLMLDWTSPYADYNEQERNTACKNDANISEEEYIDPDFRAACRKYRELQESSRIIKLIKAAQGAIDKLIDFLDMMDLSREEENGKPIYKIKDITSGISDIPKVTEQLKQLEVIYKKELQVEGEIRGDQVKGFAD